MSTVTLKTAADAVQERKRAAGLPPDAPDALSIRRTDETLGVLAGTDLAHDDLEEWARAQGTRTIPLTLAIGPVSAGASLWRDGLLIGIEYQRQRDEELRRRNTTLVAALEDVRRRLLDADVPTRPAGEGRVELHPANVTMRRILGLVEEALAP